MGTSGRAHSRAEAGKPLEAILRREVAEELGEDVKINIGGIVAVWRRLAHPDTKVFLVGFACTYTGGTIRLSSEHIDHVWIEAADMDRYKFVEGYEDVIKGSFKDKK